MNPAPEQLPPEIVRAKAQWEAAAHFLSGEYIEAIIAQHVALAVQRAMNEVLSRAEAARCLSIGESTLDLLISKRLIAPHYVGESPKFSRTAIINAWNNGQLDLRPNVKRPNAAMSAAERKP